MLKLPVLGLLLEETVSLPEKPVSGWTSGVDGKDFAFPVLWVGCQLSFLLTRLFHVYSERQALVRLSERAFLRPSTAAVLLDSRRTSSSCSSCEVHRPCGLNYAGFHIKCPGPNPSMPV